MQLGKAGEAYFVLPEDSVVAGNTEPFNQADSPSQQTSPKSRQLSPKNVGSPSVPESPSIEHSTKVNDNLFDI